MERVLRVLVLVAPLVGVGCASTSTPVHGSASASAPDEVDAALRSAELAASGVVLAGVAARSAEVCLAGAVAEGGINLAHQVYHGATGQAGGPVVLEVDATACASLGLPAVVGPDPEVEARIAIALSLAARGVALASSAVTDAGAVAALARVGAVLDLVAGAYSATVAALAAEAAAPDYRVTVSLAPDWSALGVSSVAPVVGEEP